MKPKFKEKLEPKVPVQAMQRGPAIAHGQRTGQLQGLFNAFKKAFESLGRLIISAPKISRFLESTELKAAIQKLRKA